MNAPVCDACCQPIQPEPFSYRDQLGNNRVGWTEPHETFVNGREAFFHPDCCPECKEDDE